MINNEKPFNPDEYNTQPAIEKKDNEKKEDYVERYLLPSDFVRQCEFGEIQSLRFDSIATNDPEIKAVRDPTLKNMPKGETRSYHLFRISDGKTYLGDVAKITKLLGGADELLKYNRDGLNVVHLENVKIKTQKKQ